MQDFMYFVQDKVTGMPLGGGSSDICPPFDRHHMHGHPMSMTNHKEDDSMDLEEEGGDDDKSRVNK